MRVEGGMLVQSNFWRTVMSMSVALMAVAACGDADEPAGVEGRLAPSVVSVAASSSADESTVASTTSTSSTSAPATAASPAATTSASASSTGPEAACPDGQSPLIAAYDRATGAAGWTKCAAEGTLGSVVGAAAGLVYLVLQPQLAQAPPTAGGTGPAEPPSPRLVALDSTSGVERWSVALPWFSTEVAPPHDDGDTVVVIAGRAGEAALTGLDAASGAERWRVPLVGEPALLAGSADVVVVRDPGALGIAPGGSWACRQ